MNISLQEILTQCEKTASWYGIKITDLNQRNHLGDTPLHTICSWGILEPVNILLDAGAQVNALGDHGCTPLINAIIGGNCDVVRALLLKGADVMIQCLDGQSVLKYAENVGASKNIVSLLRQASKKRRKQKKEKN